MCTGLGIYVFSTGSLKLFYIAILIWSFNLKLFCNDFPLLSSNECCVSLLCEGVAEEGLHIIIVIFGCVITYSIAVVLYLGATIFGIEIWFTDNWRFNASP